MGRLGSSLFGHYSREDNRIAIEALEEMGLADQSLRPFSALSGGQRQRVLIARALASGGDILILDEPTANIDPHAEEHLFEILSELNKRFTILLVTHDVGFASHFFKRVVCVNRRVVIHPTSALTGALISDMYGSDLHLIRHDHHCSLEGHSHD
jgi:zinc transport system ATP-binding protein